MALNHAIFSHLAASTESNQFPATPLFQSLCLSMALALDGMLAVQGGGKKQKVKPTLRKAAVVRTRRVIRNNYRLIPNIFATVYAAYDTQGERVIPMLGVIFAVSLRLKVIAKKTEDGEQTQPLAERYASAQKDKLFNLYLEKIMSSKTSVPRRIYTSMDDLWTSSLIPEDAIKEKVLPLADKMLIRSPEVVLPSEFALFTNLLDATHIYPSVLSHIVSTSTLDLSFAIPTHLVAGIISASKSSKPDTRSAALGLVRALAPKLNDSAKANLMTEILALPKAGKTTSVDNRSTLLQMAQAIPAATSVSSVAVSTLAPLIAKESNDVALVHLTEALAYHLELCLRAESESEEPTKTTCAVLAKDITTGKATTRRQVLSTVGEALWKSGLNSSWSPRAIDLAKALIPAFEANLKGYQTVATTPASQLEGYLTVALAVGPMRASGAADLAVLSEKNAILSTITLAKPKPSFLIADRLWKKVVTETADTSATLTRRWLARALSSAIGKSFENKQDKAARAALGTPLVALAVDSPDRAGKNDGADAISELAQRHPTRTAQLILDTLDEWLDTVAESSNATRAASLTRVLKTLALTAPETAESEKIDAANPLLLDLLLPAHHPYLGAAASHTWIDLVISASSDPAILLQQHEATVLAIVQSALAQTDQQSVKRQAGLNAVKTLAFVSAGTFVPIFIRDATEKLDVAQLSYIGDFERGVWQTESGTLYVDVLSQKKESAVNKNSKNYAQDKWDQEVREAIAKKKAAASKGGLSKQDQALFDAQLKKESETRDKVAASRDVLLQGLRLIDALLEGRTSTFDAHLAEIIELVLTQAIGSWSFLVSDAASRLYIKLSSICDVFEPSTAKFIGVAVLRGQDCQGIPEEYRAESVADLVTRILHQVHDSLSKQQIGPATTFYLAPLLSLVVSNSGVGTTTATRDVAMEQMTLVVEVFALLARFLSNRSYPRLTVIRDILSIADTQPGLARDAMSALIELGSTIGDTATESELQALIGGTLSAESFVRNGALQAIQPLDLTEQEFPVELYLARFDEDGPNARLADAIWEENGLDINEAFSEKILPFISHRHASVRRAAAEALADACSQYPGQLATVCNALKELYVEKAKVLAPEFDRFGMIIEASLDRPDPYPVRVAVAHAFTALTPLFNEAMVTEIFDFLVKQEALGDRSSEARQAMLNTGVAIIDIHGASVLNALIKLFEENLTGNTASTPEADHVKESVVILFGRLARHLPKGDKRIPTVVDRLLEALSTPSEIVQVAVADCLPPLIRAMPEQAEQYMERLYQTLTTHEKYAARRGAAYGLAGVVRGRGLAALSKSGLMQRLREAALDKKSYQARQGAVFAFETLSSTLGRVFEPYIISIIPSLLAAFGDANADVREATSDAARVIMSKISGHCVKQILPLLLEGLEEKQWRTKKGSIELLGAMAWCAPKQLSISLPTIIPQLTSVLTDSHAQVRTAANTSLKTFGEVLHNPEIKRMQPVLLKALADPTSKTGAALTALLGTSFEHYLDSPSLALIMPILDRGLKERSSDTKRKSVQIVGNMASLTESRDFIPYLGQLMPLLHTVLVDPVPEARATAAKALGTLVERLGEENFPSLVTKLLQTLRSDTSGVDRQGAAQGLSEVLAGLGMARMEGLLPDVINNASSPRSYVREGFISLLVYLPATFGQRFAPHLGRIIPPILGGLADESEYVRDASMRAGKMIIANYASRAIELLLPELERGMLDGAWRIRQSSISLTGELLYKVAGISGKVEIEEDEAPAMHADTARKALTEALGQDGRDRVLATLYIVRQDAVSVCRQASIHIWKALVHNTPRTTREILPILIRLIIELLGSDSHEQQGTASRTLGELCRKNGERILSEIMPILKNAVTSRDARSREGACLALTEIMQTANEDHLEAHEDTIIAAVRVALVDPDTNVRTAAARTFDAMQEQIGPRAIDETIPTLLEAMSSPGETSETALMALKEVMSVSQVTVIRRLCSLIFFASPGPRVNGIPDIVADFDKAADHCIQCSSAWCFGHCGRQCPQ